MLSSLRNFTNMQLKSHKLQMFGPLAQQKDLYDQVVISIVNEVS